MRQGDLLFEIDARDYELEIRRLQEMVNQAASSIEEADVEKSNVQQLIELAKSELELQRREVARYESLKQKNAASVSRLEAIRRAELQALNSLQTLQNQILLIKARRNRLTQEKERALTDLELATLNLGRTKVTSPNRRRGDSGSRRGRRLHAGGGGVDRTRRHVQGRGEI